MPARERDAALAAFGRWLSQERELRGLSREEVVRATRLAPSVVAALEGGEAADLPPRAYAVGVLRTYAAAVGLDADDVVLRYEEAAPAAADPAPGTSRRRARARAAIALVLALAVVAAGLWALLAL
ncbi:MAG TPA: helix-turn-helix transcriptional regulator [Anaeromyxobacteraceae bacterium]|nr:helix-turn-helix transcriptional regulator [Anaeromyxobacteraceae bacterium]